MIRLKMIKSEMNWSLGVTPIGDTVSDKKPMTAAVRISKIV